MVYGLKFMVYVGATLVVACYRVTRLRGDQVSNSTIQQLNNPLYHGSEYQA